jgi:hypothetical protein
MTKEEEVEEQELDLLQLYEYSVNSPQGDCDFLHQVFKDRYKRKSRDFKRRLLWNGRFGL